MEIGNVLSAAGVPRIEIGASGYLTIDLTAVVKNYIEVAALVAPAKPCVVVKANAYGLGADRVAPRLYEVGCRDFFVAHFGEAQKLRPHIPFDARVYVLNGLQPGNEIACAREGIIPVLNSLDQYGRWKTMAVAQGRRLKAVAQFDTGMSRLGFPPSDRTALAMDLAHSSAIELVFIMSHLASADEPENSQNRKQLAEMRQVAAEFPGLMVCFANSHGALLGPDYHGDLARAGLALYGGASAAAGAISINPVIRLHVAVVQTQRVTPGSLIGYGGSYQAATEMQLATIAAGYADGLPRSLSNRGAVYYNGLRLPIVGRVSMDSITVDITALPVGTLCLGSLVEVLGPHQTLEDLARDAGSIPYEILTSLGHRYHREYR